MTRSIIPSYCTVKHVTSLSINFAELEVNLTSMMGIWVIRKVLGILPVPSTPGCSCWRLGWFILCLHVSLSVPECSSDGHSRLIIRSACKMLWERKIFSFSSHKSAYSSVTNSQITSLFVPSYLTLYTESACIICLDLRGGRYNFSFTQTLGFDFGIGSSKPKAKKGQPGPTSFAHLLSSSGLLTDISLREQTWVLFLSLVLPFLSRKATHWCNTGTIFNSFTSVTRTTAVLRSR